MAPRILRAARRRWHMWEIGRAGTQPARAVEAAWAEALDAARRQGATWGPDATEEDIVRAVSDIAAGASPDGPADAADADAIYRLYRAGVLTGNDSAGTFTPSAPIERSAVAALVTRAANPDLRQHITLQTAAAPDFSVYWENAIQAHNVYAFHADGTVTCYAAEPLGIDPDTLWASGTAQYRIAGSRMIYTENGETTTLELVTPASLAAMGASISETLPADTAFFYETGFSSDDPLQEPLYFVPSTVTVQPQGAEPAAPAALHAGDRLTLTGVLTQQTVQAPNGSPYTAYLLRLTAPQTFSLPDGEQTLTSVQLSFTQSGMQAHLGEQITVHGDVLFAHTAYHLTPVVLMNAAV